MLQLYHWEPNANSGKPMLALAEKGVPYESHYLDLLKFDQHQPEYLQVNPDGTIPAMVHGARVLTESTPMMEYVDDEFDGPPLKPAGARVGAVGDAVDDRERLAVIAGGAGIGDVAREHIEALVAHAHSRERIAQRNAQSHGSAPLGVVETPAALAPPEPFRARATAPC